MLLRASLPLIFSVAAYAAGDARSAAQSAQDVEQKAGRLAAPMAMQFRMQAAQSLEPRHPDLARKFVDVTLEQLKAGKDPNVGSGVIRALVEVAPDDAAGTLPGAVPSAIPMLIAALAQSGHADTALALYRSALTDGKVGVRAVSPLIVQFAKTKPEVATQLFKESVAAFKSDDLEPVDAWWLVITAGQAAAASPKEAADLYERILSMAAAPEYGEKSKGGIAATFQIGSATFKTDSSRDTLLVAAGARLQKLAPARLEKYRAVLNRWDLNGPFTLRGFNSRMTDAPAASPAGAGSTYATIRQSLGQFRGLPTDADRAKLAIATAAQVRSLPAGAEKLGLAQSLCNLSTEGDLGTEAMTAVSGALAQAIRDAKADASAWLELASLIRYEHVPTPYADPALEAADALLSLRESLVQENGFTLTGLDGKTYSLPSLRGRVVLLNFWATWCPPCRKEMPDMEVLHRKFESKGLTVLAVSDEERETVTGFLQKQSYTFPVLLDPGRKVHTAFAVEGIPKSFLFDREGRLAGIAMDMRTERQFLEMLKKAGLE